METAPTALPTSTSAYAQSLVARFAQVRARTLCLAAPLSAEDAMVQSMPDASPAKWHLAHTTWFFERFILAGLPGYQPVNPAWDYLFNSYYQSIGPMHARPRRGLLTRPSLAEVIDYRHQVDARLTWQTEAGSLDAEARQRLLLGLHHEQQHQELLLTDIKHAFWSNPLHPAYCEDTPSKDGGAGALQWIRMSGGTADIGAAAWPADSEAFAYDNESPRHPVLLQPYALANRPVTHGEYLEFIRDGGYRDPALWLSDGWAWIQAEGVQRPLYWHEDLDQVFTLHGWREAEPDAPACHLSYYEADAYARWAGARLPREAEWEHAVAGVDPVAAGDDAALHPRAAGAEGVSGFAQLFGGVWEWTSSAYTAYPGYRPWPGPEGEYNGKFMNAQWVLRGGSCLTPAGHIRASYRNFFPSHARWQFAGLRLARDE
ncbi:ergothioneine biosynthesis protein EgtB [Luteimonas sp. A277]